MPSKLLFLVDHIFYVSGDRKVYTVGGKFPYSAWQTYLGIFDSVTVMSRSREGKDVTGLSIAEGEKVDFHFVPGTRGAARLMGLPALGKLIEREVLAADALVARLPSEIGLLGCYYAKKHGKPYLVEMVACPWDATWNHGSLAGKLYAPILAARTRNAVRDAPIVRYVTRKFLQGRYPTRGEQYVASNVVISVDQVCESSPALPLNKRSPVVFGTIGSLSTKLKGIDTAISALAQLKAQGIPFIYRVLGEGDAANLTEKVSRAGLQSEVFFEGVLPAGAAVKKWLQGIDVYLQPSLQEGLPRALIEALNAGCICVGSTAGGIPELLPRERMHAPGDARALLGCIKELFDMPAVELASEQKRNMELSGNYSYEKVSQARIGSVNHLHALLSANG